VNLVKNPSGLKRKTYWFALVNPSVLIIYLDTKYIVTELAGHSFTGTWSVLLENCEKG